jgi:hypothetical protein
MGGLVDTAVGAIAGALLGWLGARASQPRQRVGIGLGVVSVGVVLGWQAGLVLGLFAVVVAFLGRRNATSPGPVLGLPTLAWLAAAALAWLVSWSWLAVRLPLPG